MGYNDLILFPLFLIILSLFFKAIRNKYEDPILKKYHRRGFWAKIIACIAFIIYNVYISQGDSLGLFQQEGSHICSLILHDSHHLKLLFQDGKLFDEGLLNDPRNSGYFKSAGNFMAIRLVALCSFISLGSYAVNCLLFAVIAFSGAWKLFLFFYEQRPGMYKKFALAILFFPTFIFWSGGVFKDTICIASIGWITYSLYEIFYSKKNILKNSIIFLVFGYLLFVLKIYIFICYVPFFALFIVLKNLQSIKIKLIRYLIAPGLIALLFFAFTKIITAPDSALGAYSAANITTSITNLNDAFLQQGEKEENGSYFSLGVVYDGTFAGVFRLAPAAICATFFRPFIWEADKMSQILAALESLVLIYFTVIIILKCRIFGFFKLILSDPLVMYCFFFSIVFGLFVGASTLNFGSLVRYKIPCLPFYAIALFLIHEKVKERASRNALQKGLITRDNSINYTPALS